MKRLLFLAAFFVSTLGVTAQTPESKAAKYLIKDDQPFGTNSRLKLEEIAGHVMKIESGTVNGVAYEFHYSDGSGMFAGTRGNTLQLLEPIETNWLVACKKDVITDEKSCHMDRGDVRLWVDSLGRSEIYIGVNHYPGSWVTIRIDKGSPLGVNSRQFNGSFGFRASPLIIKRISRAKIVSTRYQEWPYQDFQGETWEPYGFNEAASVHKMGSEANKVKVQKSPNRGLFKCGKSFRTRTGGRPIATEWDLFRVRRLNGERESFSHEHSEF